MQGTNYWGLWVDPVNGQSDVHVNATVIADFLQQNLGKPVNQQTPNLMRYQANGQWVDDMGLDGM